jgi:hypothetical protein
LGLRTAGPPGRRPRPISTPRGALKFDPDAASKVGRHVEILALEKVFVGRIKKAPLRLVRDEVKLLLRAAAPAFSQLGVMDRASVQLSLAGA